MTDRLKNAATRAIACLDLTNLDSDCSAKDIRELCQRAQTRHGNAAAVCIWPQFIKVAKTALTGSNIKIATVVNFPQGDHPVSEVTALTAQAIEDGADEIDMVVPWKMLLEGHAENIDARVARVRKVAGEIPIKAIIETGMLTTDAQIKEAALHAIDGGADFVKTSTGKVPVNATPQAARVILEAIASQPRKVGFKAAGGLRTTEDAAIYLAIADEIMGEDWVSPDTFRFGASGVLTALLATLNDAETPDTGSGY